MRLITRTAFLSGILGALALVPSLHQSAPASAAPSYHTHVFSVLVYGPNGWLAPHGSPAQSYVNGQPCGWGIVDAPVLPYTGVVDFHVPAACAYPGASVELIVGGYNLKEEGGWGVNPSAIIDGVAYSGISSDFLIGPSGRWMGNVIGVPAGAAVEARINGKTCGSTKTFALSTRSRVATSGYDLKVMPAAPSPYGIAYCGFDGAKVEFFVNGLKTNQVGTWSSGPHLQDLAAQ